MQVKRFRETIDRKGTNIIMIIKNNRLKVKCLQQKLENMDWLNIVLGLWTFCAVSYMTFQMIITSGDSNKVDYIVHINAGIKGESYSLLGYIIRILYILTGEHLQIFYILFASVIGILVVMTAVNIRYAIQLLIKTENNVYGYNNREVITLLSYGFVFLGTIKIPFKTSFYIMGNPLTGEQIRIGDTLLGTLITQPWHNATYIGMRCFAILSFAIWVKIWKKNLGETKSKDYLKLFILLLITNSFKPNFIIAFAPALFIFYLIMLLRKKTSLIFGVEIGVVLLLSMGVLVYQYTMCYPADESSGVTITLGRIWAYLQNGYLIWLVLASYLFPVIVTLISYITRRKNEILFFSWIFTIVTFAEKMLLTETGDRMLHDNFSWNMMLSSLVLFIVCIVELMVLYKQEKDKRWILWIAVGILILQLINGFMYFGAIFVGNWYAGI